MRVVKVLFVLMALGFGGAGVALLVYGVTSDSIAKSTFIIVGATFVVMGVVFLVLVKFLGKVVPPTVKNGVAGTGRVISVRDTGVTLAGNNAVMAACVEASAPGIAPYEAELRIALGRTQWGALQPGMVVPIQIDPVDHARVAYDDTRQAHAGAAGVSGMGGLSGSMQPHVTTRNAADVVERGIPTMGVLQSVVPTGATAGQFAPGLPADQADDPVMQVTIDYAGPGGAPMSTTVMVRVPDGKAGYLAAGLQIPARYLPEQPAVATIDWDRLA